MLLARTAALSLVLLSGCCSFDDSVSSSQAKDLDHVARVADLAFVGIVRSIGESPGRWSSGSKAVQRVTFLVDAVLAGTPPGAESIEVEYDLLKGTPIADPDVETLAPALFFRGNKLIVLVRGEASPYLDAGAGTGTVQWTETNETAIRCRLGPRRRG